MTINTGTHTEITKIQIDGSQGKLSAIVQKPQTKPGEKIPMVLLFHGFSSNKQDIIISTLADKLSAKGIASIRIDFNGHGESEGAFYKMTVLNEIEDAKKTLNYAKTLNYVSSVSVAGHSQGGVVASMLAGTAGEEQIQSAVLLAPAAVLRDDAIRGQTFGVMYDPFNPPEKIQLGENFFLGGDYVRTAFTLPIYETARKYTGPVCLIHGTGDRVVPYTYSEHYHELYKNSTVHLLPKADHGFSQDLQEATNIAVDFLAETTGTALI